LTGAAAALGAPYAFCLDLANLRPAAKIELADAPFLVGAAAFVGLLEEAGACSPLLGSAVGTTAPA